MDPVAGLSLKDESGTLLEGFLVPGSLPVSLQPAAGAELLSLLDHQGVGITNIGVSFFGMITDSQLCGGIPIAMFSAELYFTEDPFLIGSLFEEVDETIRKYAFVLPYSTECVDDHGILAIAMDTAGRPIATFVTVNLPQLEGNILDVMIALPSL